MNILVLGASGFIGGNAADALEAAGFSVRRGARPEFDFRRRDHPEEWRPKLTGIDVVINAVGIIRDRGDESFDAIHVRGPLALFEACAAAGVKVVQISALGADEAAVSAFHRSKKQADDALLALGVPCVILQPSLVYGPGGNSARLFTQLAALPITPVPGDGRQRVQPVHIDDLCAAVVAVISAGKFTGTRIPVVGPEAVMLRDFLSALRRSLGLGRAHFLPIPLALVRLGARTGTGLLDPDTLGMLERGNTGDPAPLHALLGHAPRPTEQFIDRRSREATRTMARLEWLLPLLRIAIAAVWITAAFVSAFFYPVEDSLALLAATGITGPMAGVALYGAAALDLVLGIATLVMRRRRWLWIAQIILILAYTAIITVYLPEQWLHPYGPVVKNLPMLAAILLLYQMERR